MTNDNSRTDASSHSNFHEVISEDLHLDWTLDFDKETLVGSATHTMKVLVPGTSVASFDSAKLSVKSVTVDNKSVKFWFEGSLTHLGQKLCVEIPAPLRVEGRVFQVSFVYTTDAQATAIQWIEASGTKGGVRPFVFTQSQAIHARSLFPCQDSPAVKTPYSADVKAPSWSVVLMSALQVAHAIPDVDGQRTFKWKQPVPTPAYLVALAAGRLESRDISPRVRVWAEPEVVEAAAFEFSETEEFLAAAEAIASPYVWSRYDVLCLPPSFPYGGMENPCLTFATPTLLAGDKSLADVIAHEIAHSWTGNLVTNATWEHFWLNEGWTVWLERKIIARVKGGEERRLLSAQIGWKALADSVEHMGVDAPFTALVWPLKGEDPDDAFSSVPYEKGFNLLYQLECLVGSRQFESFAKAYISKFHFSTVTSAEFRDYFVSYFADNAAVQALDWHSLFHSTGMPAHVPNFANSLADESIALAGKWLAAAPAANVPTLESVGPKDMDGWSSQQKCVFLENLLVGVGKLPVPFSSQFIEKMDLAYALTASNNSEIKFRWQSLCLQCEVQWIVPHAVAFLASQGRMKFVRPLYRALKNARVGENGRIARETFKANATKYHPIARKMIAQDLNVSINGDAITVAAPSAAAQSSSQGSGAGAKQPAASATASATSWTSGLIIAAAVIAGVAVAMLRK